MTDKEAADLAATKGLSIDKQNHGFGVIKDSIQIRFCFSREKLIEFLQSYGDQANKVDDNLEPSRVLKEPRKNNDFHEKYMPVAEYSKNNDIDSNRIIEKIRSGELIGRIKNDVWYIHRDQAPKNSTNVKAVNNKETESPNLAYRYNL